MKVLVIPEDFRKDQYMLKPIIEVMMLRVGRKAIVRVCQDPLLGGVSEALNWSRIREILDRYPMIDLFLLCVDRDGMKGRQQQLTRLETQAAKQVRETQSLLAENAWQEIEVWVLAGLKDLPHDWSWQTVRAERDPKERFFLPMASARNLLGEPGEGRRTLGREAAAQYSRIARLCPEIASLQKRISARFAKS